jgi:hypothetical protein
MTTPRLVPDEPLPPYTFVPGRSPHPVSDPAGHSFGVTPRPETFDPARWQDSHGYLRGLDLFNHGFFWEAHEAWEALWHACGRRGVPADLLKGLIRLAAAGVKAREGRPAGVRSHAAAAGALFAAVARALGVDGRPLGLDLADLAERAHQVEALAATVPPGGAAAPVFDFVLLPSPTP